MSHVSLSHHSSGGHLMIKPFIAQQHDAEIVEVEDFGIINLKELPIRIHEERQGRFEITWANQMTDDGKTVRVLSEVGGYNQMDFGGRSLGVIAIHDSIK